MTDDRREEDTPPRGGARYSLLDIGSLAERAADRAMEAVQVASRCEAKLDLALRPITRPWYVNAAIAVIAACMVVVTVAVVVRGVPIASAAPEPRAQASAQK